MSKKSKKSPRSARLGTIHTAEMTLRDIKKECIIRGLPFEEVCKLDIPNLYQWLHNNHLNDTDESLLNQYDDWMEEELRSIGREDLIHDNFRFSYIGDKSEEVKPQKREVEKKPRKRREKNSFGLFSGTRKAMVYEAQAKGWSVKKTIRKVTRAFPDAKEKSIKIWYNKAQKENGKKEA